MEERKLMKLGRSSLVISLPKNWIDLNNLKQGDKLSVEVQGDHSLSVYPSIKEKKKEKNITLHIDVNEDQNSISRSIIACYLNGYSSIRLVSRKIFTTPQQRAIRHVARILFLRIMESDSKNIQMKTLVDESRTSILSNLDRMHMIAVSMCRDALNALFELDKALAKTVYSLDDDVDQFCFFILRILRTVSNDPALLKKLNLEPIDCQDYQVLTYRIEHVADHAASIAKN
ncbi:MAG: AbrB/MazE/SpoVT family DNA-binding domain-containing protein, partial [Candidatus Lokiarchaeota archaeon]|nr:AbrB/MazE/SpoVT family DNA-binding domain-containing protein [Candidatus Lokiarchaeota archaeon]